MAQPAEELVMDLASGNPFRSKRGPICKFSYNTYGLMQQTYIVWL